MEISIPRLKIVINIFLIILVITSSSCAAQKNPDSDERLIYDLIENHYKIAENKAPSAFLYFKTLAVSGNQLFQWSKNLKLSDYLMDPYFKKNCKIILEVLNEDQVEELDDSFLNLESVVLDEKKLSRSFLNTQYPKKETYPDFPDAATKKISFPILIKGKNRVFAIFAEEGHNAGGELFIYELKMGVWQLFCWNMLWIV